jgi:hypothetical protein
VRGDYRVGAYTEKDVAVYNIDTGNRSTKLNKDILSYSHLDEPYSVLRNTIQRKGIYIAMTATFFGLFAGIPLLIWFWSTTVVSIGTVFVMLFISGSLGLIQWKYVRDYLDMEYHQFSMYAFSGFGMCLMTFVFCLNTFFPIHSENKTYDIVSFNNGNQGLEVTLIGEGNSAALERNVATYLSEHYELFYGAKKVLVTSSTGLFGMDRLNACQVFY